MSTTLFAHPAARLVKHIPPLDRPHINGALRRDLLGPGTTRGTEGSLGVVLADHEGPLQVCSVPDPTLPGMATLVLVIDAAASEGTYGAQRRAVVPFRLFEQSPVDGAPGLPSRRVYDGLGAGTHGIDGGSVWFVEDEREEGAMDRVRWSNLGRGNRAVWTLWLMGAPAPVVGVLGELLEVHPRPITKLPPMLEDSYPWRDTYVALPQQLLDEQEEEADTSAESEELALLAALAPAPAAVASPAPTVARRNAPPPMPPKPAALRSGSVTSTSCTPRTPIEVTQLASLPPSAPAAAAAPSLIEPTPAPAPPPTLGTLRSSVAPPDYRHSLVAVDNETGEIVGILARDVRLDGTPSAASSAASSSEGEEELVTPLDGFPLGAPASVHERDVTEKASGQATPKQASVRRAAGVYYDEAARREASRHSVLGADTFAPPPVPDKATLLPPLPAGAAVRDSMASANFFSAAESGDESDAPEAAEEEGWARVHARHASAHRPDLLRDEDDDARSDVSGSTVGGPAVRMWRRARGLPKMKPGKTSKLEAQELANVPRRRDGSNQRSDASVRTSRAETAMEELESEREEEEEEERRFSVRDPLRSASQEAEDLVAADEEEDTTLTAAASASDAGDEADDALGHMRTSTSASGIAVALHGHRSRALMRSSEVRSREDQLWRDAFDAEALPIDAPYTHLAAASLEPAAPVEKRAAGARMSDEGMEMLPKGTGAGDAAAAPDEQAALQGNTVLLSFLQGSRIGATLLAGPAASLLAASEGATSLPAPDAAPLRKGAMAYIPVLPSHFLWWLGIADEDVQHPSAAPASASAPKPTSTALAQAGPDLSAVLSRAGASSLTQVTSTLSSALSSLTDSATWLFGGAWAASSPSSSEVDAISDADRDADAEEWEWAVPDFRADSLASTPRPVYRRRRPNPSPTGGFAVRQIGNNDDAALAKPGTRELVGSTTQNGSQRYSIIHYDAQGVGRRAFLSAAGGPPLGIGGLF